MGSAFPALDWQDPKTLLLLAFAAALIYLMFFRKDQRTRRRARRGDVDDARQKYRAELERIREAYA